MRNYAIVSAGRSASTTLMHLMHAAITQQNGREPTVIWQLSPVEQMQQLYLRPDGNAQLIKGETYHFIDALKRPETFYIAAITRVDNLRQVLSHVVALKSGIYHQLGIFRKKVRVDFHDFMAVSHLILGTNRYIDALDVSRFGKVVKTTFEEMTADFSKLMHDLELPYAPTMLPAANRLGLKFDREAFENWGDIISWAQSLVPYGFNLLPKYLENAK